jgi:hypothetical protein
LLRSDRPDRSSRSPLPPRSPAALLPIEKKKRTAPPFRSLDLRTFLWSSDLSRSPALARRGPAHHRPVASRLDRQGPRSPAFRRPRSPSPMILLARCLDPLVRTRRTSGVWRPGATLTPRLELAPVRCSRSLFALILFC